MERWNPEVRMVAQGLQPITPKQMADAERDCVYIFNVSPRQFGPMMVNGRNYVIPGRKAGQKVSDYLKIPGSVPGEEFKRTIGICTNEFSRTWEDGELVAKKIMGIAPFCQADQDLTRWGVFASSSEYPTQEEIAAAKEQWHERCNDLVNEARGFYAINNGMVALSNGRMVSNIAEQHRVAANELGIAQNEPWAAKTVQMTRCESCGVACLPDVAFCTNGCIVNEAKARKAKPWLFQQESRGPGRPRKEQEEVAA